MEGNVATIPLAKEQEPRANAKDIEIKPIVTGKCEKFCSVSIYVVYDYVLLFPHLIAYENISCIVVSYCRYCS